MSMKFIIMGLQGSSSPSKKLVCRRRPKDCSVRKGASFSASSVLISACSADVTPPRVPSAIVTPPRVPSAISACSNPPAHGLVSDANLADRGRQRRILRSVLPQQPEYPITGPGLSFFGITYILSTQKNAVSNWGRFKVSPLRLKKLKAPVQMLLLYT